MTVRVNPAADKFHDHLDACEQCRNKPFDLCPVGAALLIACVDCDCNPCCCDDPPRGEVIEEEDESEMGEGKE